ncbi:hypothetical protein AOG23_23270 [Rhizobium acidisoli]|nr:hypothetical protein AOG23_23270 [Rhizobium acidisoli]
MARSAIAADKEAAKLSFNKFDDRFAPHPADYLRGKCPETGTPIVLQVMLIEIVDSHRICR